MSHRVPNLRVRRTQKLLREALIALIEERGFEALTIGELTERAMVSRAAFYRQYHDKYALVEQIFEEAMQSLLGAVGELGRDHPAAVWVRFFDHIAQYDRLYGALLGRNGSSWFRRKMRSSLAALIVQQGHLPHHAAAADRALHADGDELVPVLVATLFVEAITWWLEHGRPTSAQEMATRSARLAAAVFNEARTWR